MLRTKLPLVEGRDGPNPVSLATVGNFTVFCPLPRMGFFFSRDSRRMVGKKANKRNSKCLFFLQSCVYLHAFHAFERLAHASVMSILFQAGNFLLTAQTAEWTKCRSIIKIQKSFEGRLQTPRHPFTKAGF